MCLLRFSTNALRLALLVVELVVALLVAEFMVALSTRTRLREYIDRSVNRGLAHSDSQVVQQQVAQILKRAAAVFFDIVFQFAHCFLGQLDVRRAETAVCLRLLISCKYSLTSCTIVDVVAPRNFVPVASFLIGSNDAGLSLLTLKAPRGFLGGGGSAMALEMRALG
jgi:hypothetical protein